MSVADAFSFGYAASTARGSSAGGTRHPRACGYCGVVAYEGQAIDNPMTGERIVFRETGRTTGGRVLRFELFVSPGGRVGGAPHKHPYEERFWIVRGALGCRIGHALPAPEEAASLAASTDR